MPCQATTTGAHKGCGWARTCARASPTSSRREIGAPRAANVATTASLLAGTVMHFFGWRTLMLVPIPILVAICIALVAVRKDPLLERRAALIQESES